MGIAMSDECQKEKHKGRCCCNCIYHIEDLHHCTTVKRQAGEKCVCSKHKGWICMSEDGKAHSGWTEHGMCEIHIKKE